MDNWRTLDVKYATNLSILFNNGYIYFLNDHKCVDNIEQRNIRSYNIFSIYQRFVTIS